MNDILALKQKNFKLFKQNIETQLAVRELQTYFPVIDNYVKNNDTNKLKLKSRYSIIELVKNKTENLTKKQSPYIKTFYEASIYDHFNKIDSTKTIFIKKNPLLDVIGFSIDEFSLSKKILPDYISCITSDYINNFNNEAYIDAFFTFLGSKLTESGKCPTFPLFYGTYSCISKKLRYDITEDYSSIKYNKQFKQNVKNKFSIEEINIDIESGKHIELEILNKELELDNLDPLETDPVQKKLESLKTMEDLEESYIKYNGDLDITTIDTTFNFSELNDSNTFKYMVLSDFPTQLICMEKLEYTLDDLLDEEELADLEWLSILFQICFGLAVAQKKYQFVHNDLHSSNIMFSKTKQEFLYYKISNTFYKIPTFGRITKIIDFGRATFTHNKIIYFSSTFDENGDAEGQYDYPENNSLKECNIKPNKSFDLARLATTIIEHFEPETTIFKLIKTWMTDKYNHFLINEEDDFDLYKKIAKDVNNAIPIKQLHKPVFRRFVINNTSINKNNYVFRY